MAMEEHLKDYYKKVYADYMNDSDLFNIRDKMARADLQSMGLTKSEINRIAAEYKKSPKERLIYDIPSTS